jgi:hypothetical protein
LSLHLGIDALRTLTFVVLVFCSQATIYAIRGRRHWWESRPSLLLGMSSVADIGIASTLAVGGIAMTPLPAVFVAGTLGAAVMFAFILDLIKVAVFSRLGIAGSARARPAPHGTHGNAQMQAAPTTATDQTARIAQRAYELYEQGGRKDGAAVQNWQQAEAQIRKDPVE